MLNIKLKSFLTKPIGINTTERKFYLIFFVVISAFLFLNFFEPFGLYYNKSKSKEDVFIELFIAMMVAFFILLFSQFIIRNVLKVNYYSVGKAIIGFFAEALLIASAWSVLDIKSRGISTSVFHTWAENLIGYCLIMFLPYSIFMIITYFRDELKKSKEKISNDNSDSNKQVVIKDDSDTIKLITDINNFLYLKSADNYVEIIHFENGKPTKSLIRNTIKKLESEFENLPIIRCHRSYMINTNKIESARKTSSGFDVRIDQVLETVIPVSRSYVSELKKHVNSFN
jgi:hypothetical protein